MDPELVLLTYRADYADEFDVHGFYICSKKWWDDHLKEVKKNWNDQGIENQEHYFGTNEAIIYDSFEDYKRCFTEKTITAEEAQTLRKLFGSSTFGRVLFIEEY